MPTFHTGHRTAEPVSAPAEVQCEMPSVSGLKVGSEIPWVHLALCMNGPAPHLLELKVPTLAPVSASGNETSA